MSATLRAVAQRLADVRLSGRGRRHHPTTSSGASTPGGGSVRGGNASALRRTPSGSALSLRRPPTPPAVLALPIASEAVQATGEADLVGECEERRGETFLRVASFSRSPTPTQTSHLNFSHTPRRLLSLP